MNATRGLHHVTAICSDPQANADFYTGVLGLRLVKRTVNFDDPTTYHLYYGDDLGYAFQFFLRIRPSLHRHGAHEHYEHVAGMEK